MVQFSYSYMTTGKTIALTVWTLVSKVVSLGWFREWIKYEVWEGLLEEVCLNWELKGENDNNSGDDWKEFPGEFSCSKREWEAFEELKEDWHGVHRKRRVQSESGEEGKTEFSGSCEPSCEVVLILNAVELERGGYQISFYEEIALDVGWRLDWRRAGVHKGRWLEAYFSILIQRGSGLVKGGSSNAEKAMAPHSSTLAWDIPWTEVPGRLQSLGSWRVRRDWATLLLLFTFMHWRRKWQPTPVFLPGDFQGQRSLVGCHLWGRTESDTTEAT